MAESDAFYQELLPTIEDVFVQFGAELTIYSPERYDKSLMRNVGGGAPRKVLGVVNNTAVASNVAIGNQMLAALASNQNWKSSVQLLLPPSANPKPDEEVEVDGKRYSLGSVTTLKPANVILLYTLELTK